MTKRRRAIDPDEAVSYRTTMKVFGYAFRLSYSNALHLFSINSENRSFEFCDSSELSHIS